MTRVDPIVLSAQPDPAVLIVVVIMAIAAVSNATGVLRSLIADLVGGLWAGVKAIVFLAVVLICLLYLLLPGAGPG